MQSQCLKVLIMLLHLLPTHPIMVLRQGIEPHCGNGGTMVEEEGGTDTTVGATDSSEEGILGSICVRIITLDVHTIANQSEFITTIHTRLHIGTGSNAKG